MGVFSEHLPAFNFSSGAMEACLAVKNKNQFGTALRRHVRNAAKRLKVVSIEYFYKFLKYSNHNDDLVKGLKLFLEIEYFQVKGKFFRWIKLEENKFY